MAMLIANIETETSPKDGSIRPAVWVMTYEFKGRDGNWIPQIELYISCELAMDKATRFEGLPSLYRNVKYSRRIVWEF